MIYEKKPLIERECIYCGQIYNHKKNSYSEPTLKQMGFV